MKILKILIFASFGALTGFAVLNIEYIRDNGSLWIANLRQDIHLYTGTDVRVRRYNEALYLAQAGKYSESRSLLDLLISHDPSLNPADIYELYGDDLHALHTATGDVIKIYEKSLTYEDRPRVHAKIDALTEMTSATGTTIETSKPTQSGSDSSGSLDPIAKQQELQDIQHKRSEYLNQDLGSSDHGGTLIDSITSNISIDAKDW